MKTIFSTRDTVVVVFGRFNPPTIGHEKLVEAMKTVANKYSADHFLVISRTQDAKKNPLSGEQKLKYTRKAFPGVNVVLAGPKTRTLLEFLHELSATKKYKTLIVVAGSDRVLEFKTILDKYNNNLYEFKTILVVSAGERDPENDNTTSVSVDSISASKMRTAAAKNDFEFFRRGAPSKLPLKFVEQMFVDVRQGMKMEKSVSEEKYKENVYASGDFIVYEGKNYVVKSAHRTFLVIESAAAPSETKRVWIDEVKKEGIRNQAVAESTVSLSQQLQGANIIANALDVKVDKTEKDPETILNIALKHTNKRKLNPEEKKILSKMLQLAQKLNIKYDRILAAEILRENFENYSESFSIGASAIASGGSDPDVKVYLRHPQRDLLVGDSPEKRLHAVTPKMSDKERVRLAKKK